MDRELAKLFAKMLIARSDVKAIQRSSGAYNPTVDRDPAGNVTKTHPFTMEDLLAHISGERTYGHYLLNTDSQCKFFAFDIDLDEYDPEKPNDKLLVPTRTDSDGVWHDFALCDPRQVWLDRSQVIPRAYLKYQMRSLANQLASAIHTEFEMQTAVTYTGAKGVHVYGFTGLMPAIEVRSGAELIMAKLATFEPYLGSNFFKHKQVAEGNGTLDHQNSYQCFTVEVFPKQTQISGDGYGNLMRLPLGKNLKNPKDPTFFVDLRAPLSQLTPREAKEALTTANQWA